MNDSERKGWKLLIKTGLNPAKWQYNGRVVHGTTEYSFTHNDTNQEIVLVEREEYGRENNRSFLWYAPSRNPA